MMAFAEIAVTGSVSFSLGDSTETETALPTFSGASTATGAVSIATDDEKVVASVGFNLMPAITVAAETFDIYGEMGTFDGMDEVASYQTYMGIEAAAEFFNDHAGDTTAKDDVTIWGANAETELETGLVNGTFDMVASDDDADGITLTTPIATTDTAETDEFLMNAANIVNVNAVSGTFLAEIGTQYDEAIEIILGECSTNFDFDESTYVFGVSDLDDVLTALTEDELKDWTADDKALVAQAYALEKEYLFLAAAIDGDAYDPTVTAALNFVTSASMAFKDVAGVLDITMNLMGTHVSAGNIMVDGAGHTSTAVKGYPSLMVGLSSGVVDGVNAGLTLYIDDNAVQEAVSDTWYTWMDEAEAMAEPVYGLGVAGGYTMAGDDMTVGANVAFGLYDLAGDMVWALSIAPMFSGYDANVGVQFDYGMDMMYLMASVDYTIMGITPSVAFHYLANTGDNVLAYAASTYSVMADYKNSDGMLLEAGLAVDLTDLIGMGVSVNGGMDYDLTDSNLAWNAGVSAAGLVDGLTVGFDCDADAVEGSTFDWGVSASYVYGIATLSASVGSDYNTTDSASYTSWSLGTTVSF
ncbi:MAG TPA: hypothetical protein DCO79_11155 [Spirochaeta sp.]|nr:hypothetical protein [Spirochaeta sp.]